ncbi:MAG: LysM peptidoglycan-binding domain-containing protein [Oligoflexia bacterium]|nr:LysM peptidoglycan-binding domain-containing protein [Oligoflexia bacterium]
MLIALTLSCSSGDKEAGAEGSAEVSEAAVESVEAAPTDEAMMQDPSVAEQPIAPADEAVTAEAAQDMNAVAPTDEFAPLPEDQQPTETAQTEAPPTDPSLTEAPPAELAQTETQPAEQTDNNQNDLFGGAATTGDALTETAPPVEEAPVVKKSLPLAHIKSKPFKKGGQLLNTVYIAREGDTLASISEKLFAEDKTKMLKKANPHLKKSVKTGAKVYFNSPNRPDDADRMLTVYEDQGLPPTTYMTNDGDTLKSLAMQWYGTEASYKEIYAINRNLSSTTDLPVGTELQYWPPSASIIAYSTNKPAEEQVAQAPEPMVEPPAPAVAEEVLPPAAPSAPPADAMAQNQPPPTDPLAAGTVTNTLPPPPPDLNAPTLPPPPAAISKKKSSHDTMDKDTIMYAVAAGVLLVGGGALVAIRRKNAKRNSGVTQI